MKQSNSSNTSSDLKKKRKKEREKKGLYQQRGQSVSPTQATTFGSQVKLSNAFGPCKWKDVDVYLHKEQGSKI